MGTIILIKSIKILRISEKSCNFAPKIGCFIFRNAAAVINNSGCQRMLAVLFKRGGDFSEFVFVNTVKLC